MHLEMQRKAAAREGKCDLSLGSPGAPKVSHFASESTSRNSRLKRHRIRRLTAAGVLERLKAPAIPAAAGTVNAATAHLEAVGQRLDLVNRQIGEANDRIDHLTERLADGEENAKGQLDEQRDVTILR